MPLRLALFFAFLLSMVAASCSSGSDAGAEDLGGSPNASSSSGRSPSATSAERSDSSTPEASSEPSTPDAVNPTCDEAADCPYWYCECGSGPPVNTRHCTNHRCEDAPTACPRSCKGFDTCWTGIASGGFDGGSNAGPDECTAPPPSGDPGCGDKTSFTDLGKACADNAQCESGQCWGVNPSFACTKRCTGAGSCPSGWRCAKTNANFDVCMQGALTASGPVSTNESCAQVVFSDLGGGCTVGNQCQSGLCLTSNYCSKRCEGKGDCPQGWSCTTGSSLKFCTK